jgi:outer membrane usher protein
VKVPKSPGVRVLANNQLAGRTGRRGSLLVPDLRSYLSSPIGIVQDDLPIEVQLGAVSQDIAVPYRGGAVVVFEAKLIRALTGRLDVAGKPPEYGTLSVTVGGNEFSSPLNANGEFYFEDLPPGDHPGVATWSGRTCLATIHMPDKAPPTTEAGSVTCVEQLQDGGTDAPGVR